ncbi:MAG: hypothetical protein ABLT11_00730 [Candidatus Acidiferrum sp.]
MQHALTLIAYVSLAVAFSCALWIALDELKHPQKMWIMNLVWPVTALYFSVAAVWAYYKFGRKMERKAASQHARGAQKSGNDRRKSSQLTWSKSPSPRFIAVLAAPWPTSSPNLRFLRWA